METNLRDVILDNHRIELVSVLFTIGVAIGAVLKINSYFLLGILPLFIVLYRQEFLAVFLCGFFAFSSCYISGFELYVPFEIRSISTKLCDFIDSLPFENSDLAKVFLQGERAELSIDTIDIFRKAGASHLLALSGIHMGIIYFMVEGIVNIVGKFFHIKWLRYFLLVGSAVFFTLMVGARPSIVRACLFILVRETGLLFQEKLPFVKTLCIALLIQLAINPIVIRSIGFQLSYLAVTGIAIFLPIAENWYIGKGPLKKIWKIAATSIAAQLFTAPVSWFYFHNFPIYFLLANLIAIPLTTIFMGSSILAIVLSAIGVCPTFIYSVTDFVGNTLLFSLEVIASL